MMGSPKGDKREKPLHRVQISRGFFIGKYEVTQGQWQAVMGTTLRQQRDKANPSFALRGEGNNYPMYYVNWEDAQDFIQALNLMDDGYFYRLPTEAEWEYVSRAGTTGEFAGSSDAVAWYANNSGDRYLDATRLWETNHNIDNYYAVLDQNNNRTHAVGTKQPNAWGIYDLLGNVFEWCQDYYDENYYQVSPAVDPKGPTTGIARAVRGG